MRRLRSVPPIVGDIALVGIALLDVFVHDQGIPEYAFALSVLASVALIFRRRAPLLVLAITLPALFVGDAFLAPEIALFSVAYSAKHRAWPLIGAVCVVVGQMFPAPPFTYSYTVSSVTLALVEAILFAAAPVFLGLLLRARELLLRRLDEIEASQRREAQLITETVLSLERARLAREMHDVVAHNVSLIAIQSGALRLTASDPVTVEAAGAIRTLSVRTLDELRHMVGLLRAAGANTTGLAPQPSLADVPRLVAGSGLQVNLNVDPELSSTFSEQVQRAAYRTIQEGLTNVSKHAPGASATVEVRRDGPSLEVTVRNGPPPSTIMTLELPASGHGLIGLRERVDLLGGTMDAFTTSDGGHVLHALFPPDEETATPTPRLSVVIDDANAI